MKRSELIGSAAAFGIFYAAGPHYAQASPAISPQTLSAPADGVPVAVLLSEGAVMIDFAGPWEVFQDATVAGRSQPAFNLYTVAEATSPITISGGARLLPQYDLRSAPPPKVVVVPAQSNPTEAVKTWLRGTAQHADVVMSVCTGALVLAAAGLLDGHNATTHHGSFATLAMEYPNVTVKRGARFVDEGRVATSAGLSAGIDLALHVVERYFGRQAATDTAYYMEYQGQGWRNAASNVAYSKPPAVRAGYAQCPVCWMDVDPKTAPASVYQGQRYYFCTTGHKQLFDSAPARFLPT